MEKWNEMDRLPIADLNNHQLELLQSTEEEMNQDGNEKVYVIAFKKSAE